jgi:site-specific DNA recombinase
METPGQMETHRGCEEKTEQFLTEQRDGPLTEFDEEDWYSLVEYAIVYSWEDIRW